MIIPFKKSILERLKPGESIVTTREAKYITSITSKLGVNVSTNSVIVANPKHPEKTFKAVICTKL